MDGLSIITGIAITVFLMFYLSFNLGKDHTFLRVLTILSGLFMLVLIPTTTVDLQNECSILNNGTYICYYPNGTQIDSPHDTNIGTNFSKAFLWYLRIFSAYLVVYFSYTLLNYFGFVNKKSYKWRKINEK